MSAFIFTAKLHGLWAICVLLSYRKCALEAAPVEAVIDARCLEIYCMIFGCVFLCSVVMLILHPNKCRHSALAQVYR